MSYTVVNDNGVIQVRAAIETKAEMGQLAKALANAEKHLPDPPSADEPYTAERQNESEAAQKAGTI